jgi:hypothetical protein
MSVANWNSITQYLVGDQVYDGSANYYYALNDNINSNPPSADWMLVPPPVVGVSSLNTLTGALSLVGVDGTTVIPGSPGAGDITIQSLLPGYNTFFESTTHILPTGVPFDVPLSTALFGSSTGVSLVGFPPVPQFGVARTGVYRVVFSAQIDNSAPGGIEDVEIFLSRNGAPEPNTGSRVAVNNGTEVVLTISYILPINSADFLTITAFTPGTNVALLAVPATPQVPAIPSLIVDVSRIA